MWVRIVFLALAVFLLRSSAFAAKEGQVFQISRSDSLVEIAQTKSMPERLRRMTFNGFMRMGGVFSLSLFDATTNQNFWIPLHGELNGVSVTQFNFSPARVTVEIQGFRRNISIDQNRILDIGLSRPIKRRLNSHTSDLIFVETKAAEFLTNDLTNSDLEIAQERRRQAVLSRRQKRELRLLRN